MRVNIREARTHLSRLLRRVEQGEEIVITRTGKPVAKLTAMAKKTDARPLGAYEGKIWMADDFDAPLSDDLAEFYGSTVPKLAERRKRTRI
jgi:prevent-host-death family protein